MYGIDHHHVIVAIVIQIFIHYVNIQLNRTIPAQTDDNIVITQRLRTRPYSIPAQFDVNTNYTGYNRHCTSLYNVNRNVRFNPITRSTCTTSKPWYL